MTTADNDGVPQLGVLVNPVSGAGRGVELLGQLEATFADWTVEAVVTDGPDDVAPAVETLLGGDLLAVVGGDGTLGEAVDAMYDVMSAADDDRPLPPLFVVPAGRGNSVYAHCYGETDWRPIARALATSPTGADGVSVAVETAALDVGRLRAGETDRHFVLGVSAGLFPQALAAADGLSRLPGPVAYLLGATRAALDASAVNLTVTADGQPVFDGAAQLVAVGGGRYRARAFEVVPESTLADGRLHAVVVEPTSLRDGFEVLRRARTGRHVGHPRVHSVSAERLAVSAPAGIPLEVDGTALAEPVEEFSVEIVPTPLSLARPSGAVGGPDDNDPVLGWPLEPGQPGREVWYGLVHTQSGDAAFWYRYTLLSTDDGYREGRLWAALTDRTAPDRSVFTSQRIAPEQVTAASEPFRLTMGDGRLTSRSAHGRIDPSAGGPEPADGPVGASWELTYDPDAESFTPLRSRRLTAAISRLLATGHHWSRNQSIRVDGTATVGDREYTFEDAPGHQGHTVGATPPPRWRWVHCNDFDGSDAVLEALSVDGRLSICLRLDGDRFLLNRLHHVVGPRANRTTHDAVGSWTFQGAGDGVRLAASVTVEEGWQRVAYLVPNGSHRYNAHCSLADVSVTYETTDGRTARLESDRGRAEWVDLTPPIPGSYLPRWPDRYPA